MSSEEETEARSGYTASLDSLPDGRFFKVLRAGDRLVSLATQLIGNQTSNLAEAYMGIRTYFDGGKVFNRIQSGSFESRCYAAGLKFQERPHWITHAYHKATCQSPPQVLTDVTNRIDSMSKREGKRNNSQEYKDRRKRAKEEVAARNLMIMGQMLLNPIFPQRSFEDCLEYKNSLCVSQFERERIERAIRDQAADALWFEQRKCRLTASNFGTIARRESTPVGKLVKNLLYDTIKGGKPLQWGREHEEDARQAYSQAKGDTTILTHSALVIYAEHGWLACIPDDLVQDSSVEPENQQGLVEYKCPYILQLKKDVFQRLRKHRKDHISCFRKELFTLKDQLSTNKRIHDVSTNSSVMKYNLSSHTLNYVDI